VGEVPSADLNLVNATDNCSGAATMTVVGAYVITAGSCANRYSIARKYRATDLCGNFAEQTQTITVDDQIKPVITLFPNDLTVSRSEERRAAKQNLVSETENCGGVTT